MRRVILALTLLLLLLPVVNALKLNDYDVAIDIYEDYVHETLTFEFADKESKFDYFVLAPISNLEVKGEKGEINCYVEKQTLGSLIVCDNFEEERLVMDFDAYDLVDKKKTFRIFSYMFALTRPTEYFHLKVKLPFGSVFADEKKLEGTGLMPYKPLGGIQGSDGRKIFIEWELIKPPLGQTIDVELIFEPTVDLSPSIMAVTLGAILLMIGIFFYMTRTQAKTVESVMPVLDRDEKSVVSLLKERGEMTQKEIARELDVSKAKMSRIIMNLEKRGLIIKRESGRTNKIKLKEHLEERKEEPEEEKGENLASKFYRIE